MSDLMRDVSPGEADAHPCSLSTRGLVLVFFCYGIWDGELLLLDSRVDEYVFQSVLLRLRLAGWKREHVLVDRTHKGRCVSNGGVSIVVL
jgi:hypothetical protein